MKIFTRKKIYDWQVVDSTIYTYKNQRYVLVYSEKRNCLKYTNYYHIVKGYNKGHGIKGGGHSTRYKYKTFPKYVYCWNPKTLNTKKHFRVCKKIKGKTKTFGYFKNIDEAKKIAEKLK